MMTPNPDAPGDGLVIFTNERLAKSLDALSAGLKERESLTPWLCHWEGPDCPEQIGERVLKQLQAAAEAASACTTSFQGETEAAQ